MVGPAAHQPSPDLLPCNDAEYTLEDDYDSYYLLMVGLSHSRHRPVLSRAATPRGVDVEDDLCGATQLLMIDGDFRNFSVSRWEIPIRRSDEILVVLPMKWVQFISHFLYRIRFLSAREPALARKR